MLRRVTARQREELLQHFLTVAATATLEANSPSTPSETMPERLVNVPAVTAAAEWRSMLKWKNAVQGGATVYSA